MRPIEGDITRGAHHVAGRFSVAPTKSSVQYLRATNVSADTSFSFKVKTTNPRRYSVRPNVGIVWAGEEAQVTVQLPAQKETPPDMSKCKDKFQVLALPLSPEQVSELRGLAPEQQRAALTGLWASEGAKEASIDKIRCAFVFDASTRDAPIPEEQPHEVVTTSAPTSPETRTHAPPTPTAQTPYGGGGDDDGEAEEAAEGGGGSAEPPPPPPVVGGGASTDSIASNGSAAMPARSPKKSLDPALENATLREAVLAAAEQQKEAEATITALRQANERTANHLSRQQEASGPRAPARHSLAPLRARLGAPSSAPPASRLLPPASACVRALRRMRACEQARRTHARSRSTQHAARSTQHACAATPLPALARSAVRRWSKPCNRRPRRRAGPRAHRAAAAVAAAAVAASAWQWQR